MTTTNLVSTTPTRFTVVQPSLLPQPQLLQSIDTETIISARMARFKALWSQYDPPNAAQYDVGQLEFDPIRILCENNTFFEMMLRDRVNQAVRGVMLAFSVGTDTDGLGSNYPYGGTRLDGETDDAYKMRLWNSPSIFSLNGPGQGTYESYVYWTLSAPMPTGFNRIRHAAALTTRGTGVVTIPIIQENSIVKRSVDFFTGDLLAVDTGDPRPTPEQITAVYVYLTDPTAARKGLTDVINVLPAKVIHTDVIVDIITFPGVDKASTMEESMVALLAFIDGIRWLGGDLTMMGMEAALAQQGVYNVNFHAPAGDIVVDQQSVIKVDNVRLHYVGTGE